MLKKSTFLFLVFPVLIFAQSGGGKADFPSLGFSISTFDQGPVLETQTVLSFYLPVSEEFAPNVTVMIQIFDGTPAAYKELTDSQLVSAGYKPLISKVEKDVYILEYIDDNNGKKLHCYAVAKFRDGKAFLATAVSTIGQWTKHGSELVRVVDSINLKR